MTWSCSCCRTVGSGTVSPHHFFWSLSSLRRLRRQRTTQSTLSLPAPPQVDEQLAEKLEEEKWQKVEEAKKLNRYLLERLKLEAREQLDIQLERSS